MKRLLALGSLIYCLTVNAQSLFVVQSATISDLYGSTIVAKILENENGATDHIGYFNARQFTHDRSAYSRGLLAGVLRENIKLAKPKIILFLGEPVVEVGVPVKYSSVLVGAASFNSVALKAASIHNKKWSSVYVVSDSSILANLRLQELRGQLKDVEVDVRVVSTVLEYRDVLLKLQREPTGTLVLNVFTLLDEWKEPVGYDEIEQLLVATNRTHVEVGICRRGFKTAFALGPTPMEAANLAMLPYSQQSKTHISSCANLHRSMTLWPEVYRATMGKYDIVEGGQ